MSDVDRESREPQPAAAPGAPGSHAEPDTERLVTDQPTSQKDEENVQTEQPSTDAPTDGPDVANAESPQPEAGEDSQIAELQTAVAERTADLQRLQAEYVNYKRRVDRDRELTRQIGTEAVLRDLMDTLDNISAARAHGELSGGFKSVAENLEKVTTRYGLVAFGEAGDLFDPQIHEALMQTQAEGITGPTCVQVLQVGYKVKDKVLRAARVAVAEPDATASPATAEPNGEPEAGPATQAEPQS